MKRFDFLFQFCSNHVRPLLIGVFLVDWLRISRHLVAYFADFGALCSNPNNWPWRFSQWVSRDFGGSVSGVEILYGLATVTAFIALGAMWKPTQRSCTVGLWLLMAVWQTGQIFYGLHMMISVALILFIGADFARNTALVFTFGRLFLSLIYLNSGLAKLFSPAWVSGDVIWQVALYPKYLSPLVSALPPTLNWIYPFGSLTIVALQIALGLSYFFPGVQKRFALANAATHAVIACVLSLYQFSFAMIVMDFAFFGRSAGIGRVDGRDGRPCIDGRHGARTGHAGDAQMF